MIVRFIQRHAGFFAIFVGLLGYRLILPDDFSWWLKFGTGLVITLATFLLLYRYEGTREKQR